MNELLYMCFLSIVLLVVSNLWLVYRVLRPLGKLSRQTAYLTEGDLTALEQACGGIAEIASLRRSMASMVGHVRRAQAQEYLYRNALTDGQEAERARLAHDLHDDTVQSLIAIGHSIDLACTWMEDDESRAVATLKMARTQVVETADNLRRLIANLRPPALEELGLIPALHTLSSVVPDMTLTVEAKGAERRLDKGQELTLFRSAQEAIRNVQRHSRARNVHIQVEYEPDKTRLTVRDDGRGFHMPERVESLASQGHYGLLGIYERVRSHNGTLLVASTSGHGTRLQIEIPFEARSQPADAVRDPVCTAVIQPHQAYGSVDYRGQRYYFCCPVCQGAFQKEPELYVGFKVG